MSGPTLRRLRVLRGHTAHARFLALCSDEIVGEIPRQENIPSPYAYSPTWPVLLFGDRRVVVRETRHARYEVFEVQS